MRILHVVPWLAQRYGGPATLVPQMSSVLTAEGHDSEVETTNVDGDSVLNVLTEQVVAWRGARVRFHGVSWPRSYLTSWPLLTDLRGRVEAFDVVHIHCLYRFHIVAAALAARSRGVPYVIQAHGALDPWNRGRKRRLKDVYHFAIEDRIIDGAAAVVCSSRQEEASFRRLKYSVPTFVIANGIDVDVLRANVGQEIMELVHLPPESRLVTFLGRISLMKGVDLLIESFKDTAAVFPDAHLVIAGPDDEGLGSRLRAVLSEAGLASRVTFVGSIGENEKRALLQRSSVLVLPSIGESFGLAAAEAMAVGCPVVVTVGVAINDAVKDAGAGLVIERDPSLLARAVRSILSDQVTARSMADAGRLVADQRFAWPRVSSQLVAMYSAVALKGGALAAANHATVRLPAGSQRPDVLAGVVCPACHGTLSVQSDEVVCDRCGLRYDITSGIPVLLPDPALANHDELDHHAGHSHKEAQARHFDRADEEAFETSRPHGTPRMYRFLLGEKFRRAIDPLRPHLTSASALAVCGGSGMDAESLSRAGAHVITSDLSLGAAVRAATRSNRYGLGIDSIVADVERLPFKERSVDLVAVHDGLHHLGDPYAGLSEMARVARRWVVVTEPARAAATSLAVRIGLALEHEEAGNRVERLDPAEVAAYLELHGFFVLRAERYAMYYAHRPGRLSYVLSQPFLFPIARLVWRFANAVIGQFGNKMVVVAERRQGEPNP